MWESSSDSKRVIFVGKIWQVQKKVMEWVKPALTIFTNAERQIQNKPCSPRGEGEQDGRKIRQKKWDAPDEELMEP